MEIKKPKKKMGRPTVYSKAMTNAERQKRWRERVKREAHELVLRLKESKAL